MPAFQALVPSIVKPSEKPAAPAASPPSAPRPKKTFIGLVVQPAAHVQVPASREGGRGAPAGAPLGRGRGSVKAAGGRGESAARKNTNVATPMQQQKRADQQLNTHMPHGSVPAGARPPVKFPEQGAGAASGAAGLGKRKDEAHLSATEQKEAVRRKIVIPSFSLDDGDSSSSQETVEKEDTPEKLGVLALDAAGASRLLSSLLSMTGRPCQGMFANPPFFARVPLPQGDEMCNLSLPLTCRPSSLHCFLL